jgi:tetratricopeptide (TPR) repeat protein
MTTSRDRELSLRAAEKFKAGEYKDAVKLYHELSEHDPSAFKGLGLSYVNAGDYENARLSLEKALEHTPNDFMVRKVLAFIYYKKDDGERALLHAEAALSVMKDPGLQKLQVKLRNDKNAEERLVNESTNHFKVSFDGYAHGNLSRKVIEILEDAYRTIGKELDYFPAVPVSVVLYTNRDFYDITQSPQWSQGIFDGKIRIPIRGVESREGELRKVLFHEYTHAVVHSLTPRCPLWINEGLAEYFSTNYGKRIGQLIPLTSLETSFSGLRPENIRTAYWESYSAVSHLIEQYGVYRIKEVLLALPKGTDLNQAFRDAFSMSYHEFTSSWGKS